MKYFLLITVSLLSSVYIFNYTIDPFGIQNKLCEQKYKPVLNERAKKYRNIFYENNIKYYDSLILGSSRVMKIVPSNSKITSSFYNFGVHVANNAEKLYILKEWLKVKQLKTVYLGIDYFNFHSLQRPLYVNYQKFKEGVDINYFSFSTFKLSIKSLINKINDKPITYFNDDGSINYVNKDKLIMQKKYNFTTQHFIEMAKNGIEKDLVNKKFTIENRVYDILTEFKKLSYEYNFKLIVFITPMNHSVLDQLETNHQDILNKFKIIDKKLVGIFGEIYKFNTRNTLNENNENFYDPHHYRSIIGDNIVNRINNINDHYGIILNKDFY